VRLTEELQHRRLVPQHHRVAAEVQIHTGNAELGQLPEHADAALAHSGLGIAQVERGRRIRRRMQHARLRMVILETAVKQLGPGRRAVVGVHPQRAPEGDADLVAQGFHPREEPRLALVEAAEVPEPRLVALGRPGAAEVLAVEVNVPAAVVRHLAKQGLELELGYIG